MKNVIFLKVLIPIIMLIMILMPACGEREQTGIEPATVSGKDVREDVRGAYETTKVYTQEQMQRFIDQSETRFDEYRKNIDQFQAMSEKLGEDGKAKAQEHLKLLRQKRDETSEKLKELKSSSGSAWDQVKSGIDEALEDLGDAYQKAVAELRN